MKILRAMSMNGAAPWPMCGIDIPATAVKRFGSVSAEFQTMGAPQSRPTRIALPPPSWSAVACRSPTMEAMS